MRQRDCDKYVSWISNLCTGGVIVLTVLLFYTDFWMTLMLVFALFGCWVIGKIFSLLLELLERRNEVK